MKVSDLKNSSFVTQAQTWGEVLRIYTEYSETQPVYAPLKQLIERIMKSPYQQVFFPVVTMNGLLLSQTENIRMQQQNLLIRPGDEFVFEYQDGALSSKDQWQRKCKPEASFSLLEKFVDQLNLLVKTRRA